MLLMTEKLSAEVSDTQEGTTACLKDLKRQKKSESVPAGHPAKSDLFLV